MVNKWHVLDSLFHLQRKHDKSVKKAGETGCKSNSNYMVQALEILDAFAADASGHPIPNRDGFEVDMILKDKGDQATGESWIVTENHVVLGRIREGDDETGRHPVGGLRVVHNSDLEHYMGTGSSDKDETENLENGTDVQSTVISLADGFSVFGDEEVDEFEGERPF